MCYTEAMEGFENKINYQSEFLFNGDKSDTLIVFGFIFFSNENEEIQCIDLVSQVVLSPEYTKKFSDFNNNQKYVLKELGFGDYRNLIVKNKFDIRLDDWPHVKIFNKNTNEVVNFEIVDCKQVYYAYISKFDLMFSKYQFNNFKTFKNQIKLDFKNIDLITPENMLIFENEIKKALDFSIATYSRELFSNLDLAADISEIKKKIDFIKAHVNQMVESRKVCANLEHVCIIKKVLDTHC